MSKIAILITVHNRKERTLKCLSHLDIAIKKMAPATIFDIYLVDDGSTDGTWEAVKTAFPQVHLIKGNGNLYWCRGTLTAWEHAMANDDYDGFFWLNNDAYLYPDALEIMFAAIDETKKQAIIGGAFVSETSGVTTFGGKIKDKVLTPNGQLQEFEQLNGNFVFIPKVIVDRIGLLDKAFHHGIGDYDYGYRAMKAGFSLYLAPRYTGTCEKDSNYHKYRDPNIPRSERFRFLYSPLGPPPPALFKFNLRHFSFFKAISVFLYINMVCLFPGIRKVMVRNYKYESNGAEN